MTDETRDQVTPPELRNPTGKGGFRDHPENRNKGTWDKNESISYWLNKFKYMPTNDFNDYAKNNPNMTMACRAAYMRIGRMIEKLEEFKEVADRTEGKATQKIEMQDTTIDSAIEDLKNAISIGRETEDSGGDSTDSPPTDTE
jgi:hypothetical protein